jgi:hypothetical protein
MMLRELSLTLHIAKLIVHKAWWFLNISKILCIFVQTDTNRLALSIMNLHLKRLRQWWLLADERTSRKMPTMTALIYRMKCRCDVRTNADKIKLHRSRTLYCSFCDSPTDMQLCIHMSVLACVKRLLSTSWRGIQQHDCWAPIGYLLRFSETR